MMLMRIFSQIIWWLFFNSTVVIAQQPNDLGTLFPTSIEFINEVLQINFPYRFKLTNIQDTSGVYVTSKGATIKDEKDGSYTIHASGNSEIIVYRKINNEEKILVRKPYKVIIPNYTVLISGIESGEQIEVEKFKDEIISIVVYNLDYNYNLHCSRFKISVVVNNELVTLEAEGRRITDEMYQLLKNLKSKTPVIFTCYIPFEHNPIWLKPYLFYIK